MNSKNVADQYERLMSHFVKFAMKSLANKNEVEISKEHIETVNLYDMDISIIPLLATFALRNMLSFMELNRTDDLSEENLQKIIDDSMFQFNSFLETQQGVYDGNEVRTIQ